MSFLNLATGVMNTVGGVYNGVGNLGVTAARLGLENTANEMSKASMESSERLIKQQTENKIAEDQMKGVGDAAQKMSSAAAAFKFN